MASNKIAVKSAKSAADELSGSTDVTMGEPRSTALPTGLKILRVVTVPSLVLKTSGEGRTILIQSEFRISKVEGKKNADGTKEKSATICDVIDPTTGEQFIFLVPTVVQSNLERDYSDGGYVGRGFYIRNDGKTKAGQRYNNFTIIEVAPE